MPADIFASTSDNFLHFQNKSLKDNLLAQMDDHKCYATKACQNTCKCFLCDAAEKYIIATQEDDVCFRVEQIRNHEWHICKEVKIY